MDDISYMPLYSRIFSQSGSVKNPYATSTTNSRTDGADVFTHDLSKTDENNINFFFPIYVDSRGVKKITKQMQPCTYLGCSKTVKNLKTHLLTHQASRPNKCLVTTCKYHNEGFARKSDKERHVLNHYEGHIVCGFCPRSEFAPENSFKSAAIFKRHFNSVHNNKKSPSNSSRRIDSAPSAIVDYASAAAGECSICWQAFSNAQGFYGHFYNCVVRAIRQQDSVGATNSDLVTDIADGKNVHHTMEKNKPITTKISQTKEDDYEDDKMDDDVDDMATYSKSCGIIHSRAKRDRNERHKKRCNYCSSSRSNKGRTTMKKHGMGVFNNVGYTINDDNAPPLNQQAYINHLDGESYIPHVGGQGQVDPTFNGQFNDWGLDDYDMGMATFDVAALGFTNEHYDRFPEPL